MKTTYATAMTAGVAGMAAAAMLFAGCSASTEQKAEPSRDTMSMAEMRLNDAGGPSKPAVPVGVVSPVENPHLSSPSPGALTDAGPNTPLGKQWVFTEVAGYYGELPPAPTQAVFFLSRGNGRMIGNTSCNAMNAAFEISIPAGTLRFRNINNTRKMCSEANRNTEVAIIDALMATDEFRLDGKAIRLMSKGNVVAVARTQ